MRKAMIMATVLAAGLAVQAQADSVVAVGLPEGARMELVHVAGGTYRMGSDDARGVKQGYDASRPAHEATVADFYIGRTEVTRAQWRAVMGSLPEGSAGADSLAVGDVTWDEAVQFTALLSQLTGHRFRLPYEAEWEYAARGGRRGKGHPFAGCDRAQLERHAWLCTNSGGTPHPVAAREPNELGLYDMCGNVAEWCIDWMAPYGGGPQPPQGPAEGDSRVLRGGHYGSTSSACAVFDRGWYLPSGRYPYYGLRVVMEPDPQQEEEEPYGN